LFISLDSNKLWVLQQNSISGPVKADEPWLPMDGQFDAQSE
jgi:hypothetical protein